MTILLKNKKTGSENMFSNNIRICQKRKRKGYLSIEMDSGGWNF